MTSMTEQSTQTRDEEPENTQLESVNIYHVPISQNPSIVPLSLTYDASNPGVRINAPYNTNGIIVFSGLFDISERYSIYKSEYTVNPELPPKQMKGYWEDYVDSYGPTPIEPEGSWVTDYQIVFDENGIPKNLPENHTIEGLRGNVFIVKRLFNTYTCSEVPLSIEESDMSVIKGAVEMFQRTVLCPSIKYLQTELIRIWREYVQPIGTISFGEYLNHKYHCASTLHRLIRSDAVSGKLYLVGNTVHERIQSLNRFVGEFAVYLESNDITNNTNGDGEFVTIPVTQWYQGRRRTEVTA